MLTDKYTTQDNETSISDPYRKLKAFARAFRDHIMGDEIMTREQIDFSTQTLIDLIFQFNELAIQKYDSLPDEIKTECERIDETRNNPLIYDFQHGINSGKRGYDFLNSMYAGMLNKLSNQRDKLLNIIYKNGYTE